MQAANSDDALQNAQAENLLTQGVQVLVVVPHNAKTTATIVESAHKMGVPVIAYDRLIRDSDLDYYISFDAQRVGELQAEYAVKHKPKGSYVLIGGAPTDNNAVLVREGQMKVLKPSIDKGDIKVVGDQWAKDWQAVEALKIMENALTRNNNQVDAVVVSNDGTAGGAIQALGEQKLSGKVLVTGQDADLAGCQRIVAGTQTMTIYKPIDGLAAKAAEIAVKLAKKEPVTKPLRGWKCGGFSTCIDTNARQAAFPLSRKIYDCYYSRNRRPASQSRGCAGQRRDQTDGSALALRVSGRGRGRD